MNRIIKFRGWDGCGMFEDIVISGNMWTADIAADYWRAGPVMQFTGLLDKNGKEVFEGDIVRRVRLEIEYQTHTGGNIPNGSYTEPCGIICKYELEVVKFIDGEFTVLDKEDDNYFNWLRYPEQRTREDINYIFFPHFHSEKSQSYSDEDFVEIMNDVSTGLGWQPDDISGFIDGVNGIEVIGNVFESPELLQSLTSK